MNKRVRRFFSKWRYLIIIVSVIAGLGYYLYVANAFIYWRIGRGNLPDVETQHTYMIDGASTSSPVYASLGDSLTAGIGTADYGESFPYLLAQRLGEGTKGIVLKNFSYPGITSSQLISGYLDQAISSRPQVVTLLIGTNDMHNWVSEKEFAANYELILRRLKQETKAEIYAISVPHIGSNTIFLPPYDKYFSSKVDEYNNIIKALAAKYQVGYIDIATPTKDLFAKDGTHYSANSFHPSAAGYEVWAQIIYDSIDQQRSSR